MARAVKRRLQSALKVVNATIGLLGIAMITCGIWMIRVWGRDVLNTVSDDRDDSDSDSTLPWFMHAFLGIGIALCAIACLGHFAADTANTSCLSCYSIFIFILIIVDASMIADVLLNSNWEKDLPYDPSGRFDDFKEFVRGNIQICQWIAFLIFIAQGCSIFIATIIRTLAEDERYHYGRSHTDEENVVVESPRNPLLNQPATYQQFFYNCNEKWKSAMPSVS